MNRKQRLAMAAGAVVVLVAGFLVARSAGESDNDATTVTQTVIVTSAGNGAPERTTTVVPTPRKPPIETVVVRNGEPVGGVQRLKFDKGDRIQFRVRSDVSDEVHFHGYDVSKPVGPGQVARISVPAKFDGRFEVELENRAVPSPRSR